MERTHEHTHTTPEHEHRVKAMPGDLAKLHILLPHRIKHSEEHAASFREWVEKAQERGLGALAETIEIAVGQMEACKALALALKALEEG